MKIQDEHEKNYKYIRVSTPEQNTARQKDGLIPIVDICSGSIPFEDRPGGEALMRKVQLGFVGSVSVQSIDRLGRNTLDILTTIKWFTKQGVNIISQKEGLQTLLEDGTENPTAKLMIGILGTLAEFELSRIKERQMEGIAKAKERGVYKINGGNRSIETKTKFLSKSKNALCLKELKRGTSVRRAALLSGVSRMTAHKVKKYMLE
jgi:DNA invertase Pin-like site-specific DNA recombinase|tara:strand:- start:8 stop:625 length:618 start_codon:yes stop_codon:yes gene_type:complete